MASWSDADKIRAERYAMTTLDGAGIAARTIVETGTVVTSWRRVTTEAERAYVAKTPRWRGTRQ